MRTYKASKKKRTQYTYEFVTGEKTKLTSDDTDQSWFDQLHADDDAVIDADRRENYHCPVRYDALTDTDMADIEKCTMLASPEEGVLDRMVREADYQKLREAIQTLLPQQIELVHKVFYEDIPCVSIAADEGVCVRSIYRRLERIYASLRRSMGI